MGIPKFARFLINRYPLILKKLREEQDIPEIDNLYLDVNGVIHKKAHNNSVIMMCKDRTQEEIFYDIFCYIDEMVHLTKPKKLLMISADGVAPRAKMNQQRSRRYRKTDINQKDLEALRKQGLDPDKMFNSDVISAGTEFMFYLSKAFDEFVNEKLRTDPLWKDLKVIITGSDVPGEGEHKIIEYIRQYKTSLEYDQSAKHCIYGLDADLIMLSLITHEPNICILREEVIFGKRSTDSNVRSQIKVKDNFEFIYVSVLREYLELEFLEIRPRLRFEYNIERIIDDFIFFCFFIGNDFLPNLNTLDIDHGALENIFLYYKDVLPTLDDYITYHGKIDFKKAEKIFSCLANHEMTTLQKMLEKVEVNCKDRLKKQRKLINDRKKLLKVQKVTAKKENFLVSLKEKDEAFIVNFKKERVKKKIDKFKNKYEQEVKLQGKETRFQEDIQNYLRNDTTSKISKEESSDLIASESSISAESDSASNIQNKNIKSISRPKKIAIGQPGELEPKEELAFLFESDDEVVNKDSNKKKLVTDNLTNVIREVSKYHKYIQDENYCSEVNIDDIEEADVGSVSEPELDESNFQNDYEDGFNKALAENQDLDKVFQQKLLNLYITDVRKAKAFYYKEKLGIDLETFEGQKEQKNMFKKYLEGLQWVLYYYYRGVQSWRWFYPYHYAPMISDFKDIKQYLDYDLDKCFDMKQPYSPFQSLLFILPKTSRNLFPQCYWGIYDEFPHLYPTKFGIDFNGKKMPWESVVLLPFLEEETILQFEHKMRSKFHTDNKDNLLESEKSFVISDRDLERNFHGQSYIYSFSQADRKVTKITFEIYSNITSPNLDSNYQRKNVDYTFPTMKIFNYNYTFDMKKQYMGKFRDQIKKIKILMIEPILNRSLISGDKIISYITNNQPVYVNYPFKQEAVIRGIMFNNQYYYMNDYHKISVDSTWKITYELMETVKKEWYKKGVMISDYRDYNSCVLVDVSLLTKIARNSDGSLTKIYDDNYSFNVPFEVTSLNSLSSSSNSAIENDFEKLNKDYQTFARKFLNIETELNVENNQEINPDRLDYPTLILSKVQYGMLGKVSKAVTKTDSNYGKFNEENYSKYYDRTSNFDLEGKDWEVELDEIYNGPLAEVNVKNTFQYSTNIDQNFSKKLFSKSEEEYITMNELANKLSITAWSLSLITSSLYVVNCTNEEEISEDTKLSELEHWNIGLNMKSRSKFQKLILPGYTRYLEDHDDESYSWEFSKTAVDLIVIYKEKFTFVFDCLEKYKSLYNRSNKFFRIYELFSTVDNFMAKLTEVAVWINSLNINLINFAPQNSTFLSINDCRKIEEHIESKQKEFKENQLNSAEFNHMLVLNPNYLFQETLPWVPPFAAYELPQIRIGDRVVNIRSNDAKFIPFGLKGTVTAVANEYVEVLFDNEFFGGSTLNGRFKTRKGAYVKPLNLINLTNKFPVYLRRNRNKYHSWNFVPSCEHYDVYTTSYALNKDSEVKKTTKLKRIQSDTLSDAKKEEKIEFTKTYSSDSPVINKQTDKQTNVNVKTSTAPKIIRRKPENIENKNVDQNKYMLFKENINTSTTTTKTTFKNDNNQNIVISQQTQTTNTNTNFIATNILTTSNLTNISNIPTSTEFTPSSSLRISAEPYVPKRIITKDKPKISATFKTNPEGAKLTKDVQYIDNEKKKENNVAEYRINRIFPNENLNRGKLYYFCYGKDDDSSTIKNNNNLITKLNQ